MADCLAYFFCSVANKPVLLSQCIEGNVIGQST